MRSAIQEKLLNVLLKAIKPLVHLLLESGIGHREFSEIAKRAFVEVATKEYGIRGRDTNISRVAVMTGLTRKEVKKIREGLGDSDEERTLKPIPASVVLHYWFSDSDFLDSSGKPRLLNFDQGENSFRDLVKKYAGDIPPGAIRTELKRTGAIEILDDGQLETRRREVVAPQGSERLLRAIERPLTAMMMNLEYNNIEEIRKGYAVDGWPERIVHIGAIPEKERPKVFRVIKEKVRVFSEDLDDAIGSFEKTSKVASEVLTKNAKEEFSVGLGVYYFET
ncbi:MAG: DUF6502 family protein [Pseudomonadota bacterium]